MALSCCLGDSHQPSLGPGTHLRWLLQDARLLHAALVGSPWSFPLPLHSCLTVVLFCPRLHVSERLLCPHVSWMGGLLPPCDLAGLCGAQAPRNGRYWTYRGSSPGERPVFPRWWENRRIAHNALLSLLQHISVYYQGAGQTLLLGSVFVKGPVDTQAYCLFM